MYALSTQGVGAITLNPAQQTRRDEFVYDIQTGARPPDKIMPLVRKYAKLMVASDAYALPLQLDRDIADFAGPFENWLYTGTWTDVSRWEPQLNSLLSRVEAAGTTPKARDTDKPVEGLEKERVFALRNIPWWPIPILAIGVGLFWASKEGKF